jgi:choline-phosphate cytidylyltransferase
MTGAERSEIVRECRWVDEVIEDCPPVLLPEFFDECQIDYFAHDDDYVMPEGTEDPYEFVKRSGKFVVVPRTEYISTTKIITRILGQREEFVTRQKRHGVTLNKMGATDLF